MKKFILGFLAIAMWMMGTSGVALAVSLPEFGSDEETHVWLCKYSPYYNLMAKDVDSRGGVSFGGLESHSGGMLQNENGQRRILLAKKLKGAERISILIFEMTNAYQERLHIAVDERVRNGVIKVPEEFRLLHGLIEYDGLRYHRFVLTELDAMLDEGIPREMLTWINPRLTNLASYELPLAFEFVEAQAKTAHAAYYHEWFGVQKSMKPGR